MGPSHPSMGRSRPPRGRGGLDRDGYGGRARWYSQMAQSNS